jgi:hypothetical protein
MATRKSSAKGKTSSGSGPKSKRIVRSKMGKTMHEFKHHELKSGGRKTVRNPKQAIAIGLSEARRSGADIPDKSSKKQSASKRSGSNRAKKSAAKKTAHRRTAAKRPTSRKTTGRKTTSRRTAARR